MIIQGVFTKFLHVFIFNRIKKVWKLFEDPSYEKLNWWASSSPPQVRLGVLWVTLGYIGLYGIWALYHYVTLRKGTSRSEMLKRVSGVLETSHLLMLYKLTIHNYITTHVVRMAPGGQLQRHTQIHSSTQDMPLLYMDNIGASYCSPSPLTYQKYEKNVSAALHF